MKFILLLIFSVTLMQTSSKGRRFKILMYGEFYLGSPLALLNNIKNCPGSKKYTITRNKFSTDFDIVILKFTNYREFMKRYLRYKINGKRIMILYTFDPPHYLRVRRYRFRLYTDLFNYWTYSYHKSSYFYSPYGRYKEISNSEVNIVKRFSLNRRSNAAIVFISNCMYVRSLRMEYIKKLQKYFPVSAFGKCFNNRVSKEKRIQMIRKHKFVLAFENAHCDGYNTEKYWDAIKYGAIPIVMSYNKNLDHLIPNSYIDVFKFTHPYDLAIYLKKVASDSDIYHSYHSWRKKYIPIINKFEIEPCKTVSLLNHWLKNSTYRDDKTINRITDMSTCLKIKDVRNNILKTRNRS